MWFKMFSVVVIATFSIVPAAISQTISGPVNVPPADFGGQQFVDNRGCLFMRAGYGGQTTWVPRISASRKALCGEPPTFGKQAAIAMAEEAPQGVTEKAATPMAKNTKTVAAKKPGFPMETIASATISSGRTVARKEPVINDRQVSVAPQSAPDFVPNGAAVAQDASNNGVVYGVGAMALNTLPNPPKGYKMAWKDGRLNPNRAKGTAAGQYAQDQIWTRKTPAKLVISAKPGKPANISVSTMNGVRGSIASPNDSGRIIIQIGSFSVQSNAQGALGRLSSIGLPTIRNNAIKRGKPLTVIYAGPFASANDAQRALIMARQAGFTDAFIR